MALYLRQIPIGPMENLCYLVGDTEAKKCWVVDPVWDIETVLAAAEKDGMAIEGALVSHCHFDHVNAVEKLLAARHIPIYVHPREIEFLGKGAPIGLFHELPKSHIRDSKNGDVIKLGSTSLTFLHTPGHTPGSQCFLVDGNLIAGDTLFLGTCGRCDLPGGNPHELYKTLNDVLAKLPDDTMLYPGHNYSDRGLSAPMGEEKKLNRFFAAPTLDAFLAKLGF